MDERLPGLQRQDLSYEENLALSLEWLLTLGLEGKLIFFRKWTEAETDPLFLERIRAALGVKGFPPPNNWRMEAHFEAVFTKKYDQPSDRVALIYMSQIKAPTKMKGLFIKTAIRVKKRVYMRLYQRRVRGSAKTDVPTLKAPMPPLKACTVPEGTEAGKTIRRGLALLPPHGEGIWDEAAEYKVQVARKAKPEDFERLLAPYQDPLRLAGVAELVENLLQLLHENGDSPSVMVKSYDVEYQKLKGYPDKRLLDALNRVSVYDHTLHVLEYAVAAIANDERGHLHWFVPAIVTAALGHDIGKMPALYERRPKARADHAEISSGVLKRMIPAEINPEIRKYVENAVYFHHTNVVETSPAQVIMEADARARVREISDMYPSYTVGRRIDEWLDADRFADAVSREINVNTRGNTWKAMSHNGIVYCLPNFARTVVKKLGAALNVLDWRLIREINRMDNYAVLGELADLLRARGALAWRIEHPYFGATFVFEARIANLSERNYFCIPMDQTFLSGSKDEIESRKRGYLKMVFNVKPVRSF